MSSCVSQTAQKDALQEIVVQLKAINEREIEKEEQRFMSATKVKDGKLVLENNGDNN